ncbi:hypothetical protein EV644_11187 [Kribbella orskensis]|uniref:Uncharacterized protein n=1 Tax=Kribbella orskensis TaxID=2512216 RepID=A0ABY2BFN3_9ACTN|nr:MULTISPECIES: hypothetical protein [Kribbella]TCN37649.1 hypothetical protein EV642_111178 [Kribbella sp. VKM Ac-2500]TCO18849.1 hypothetical protein EV644_11187 [Kribbella orskensis]
MTLVSLGVLVALLGLLLVRACRQVYASSVERRRWSVAILAELVLWGACTALVLPRLVDLLT